MRGFLNLSVNYNVMKILAILSLLFMAGFNTKSIIKPNDVSVNFFEFFNSHMHHWFHHK